MPNWKKVIVSGSNAVLNNVTASGHMSVLGDSFSVFTHSETELEIEGNISASGVTSLVSTHNLFVANDADIENDLDVKNQFETKYRKLKVTENPTADFNGDVVFFGGAVTSGKIHRWDGTSWLLAENSSASSGKQLLAVALGGNGATNGMLIRGFVTIDDANEDNGKVLYLGAGGLTIGSPPGSGNVSRVIGYSLATGTGQIYFNPSMDWIDVT